jgi:hypothetical protein
MRKWALPDLSSEVDVSSSSGGGNATERIKFSFSFTITAVSVASKDFLNVDDVDDVHGEIYRSAVQHLISASICFVLNCLASSSSPEGGFISGWRGFSVPWRNFCKHSCFTFLTVR